MRLYENVLLALMITGAASTGYADSTDTGAVTVRKETNYATNTGFKFASPQLGDFTLEVGVPQTFVNLAAGDYEIRELPIPDWQLYRIRVESSTSAATDTFDWLTSTISFRLDTGEVLDLAFYNRSLTPQDQPPLPTVPVPSAALLTGLGAALLASLKRRRIV